MSTIPTYDFYEKIAESEHLRKDLLLKALGFIVIPTSKQEDLNGIDRMIADPSSGIIWRVDYKNDKKMTKTQNFVAEFKNTDSTGYTWPAWTYKEKLDIILVESVDSDILYWIHRQELEAAMPYWINNPKYAKCRVATVKKVNQRTSKWHTDSVLIPLPEILELFGTRVYNCREEILKNLSPKKNAQRFIHRVWKIGDEYIFPPNEHNNIIVGKSPENSKSYETSQPEYKQFMRLFPGFLTKIQIEHLLRNTNGRVSVICHKENTIIRINDFIKNLHITIEKNNKQKLKSEVANLIFNDYELRAHFRHAFSHTIPEEFE